jgi:hypothetical protein
MHMTANTTASGRSISGNSPYAEIPDLRAIYTSADEKRRPSPGEVMRAISACRVLNADVVVIELSNRTIIAAVNGYDDTYVSAICDPGVALPAVSRSLQVRLFNLSTTDVRPDVLPATIVRMTIGRWEHKIAVIFGDRYAAGLVAAMSPPKSLESVTIEDMENMRRKLSSATGDCIDLSVVRPD